MGMTAEAESFLTRHYRAFIASSAPDGAPVIHPVWAFWHEGAVWFSTYRKSAKARYMERNPGICCLVVAGDDSGNPASPTIALYGKAELMPPGTLLPVHDPSFTGARPKESSSAQKDRVRDRLMSGQRVAIRLVPDRVVVVD